MKSIFRYSSKDWFLKTIFAFIFGFTLAIALSGIFAKYSHGGIYNDSAKLQLTMWIIAPIWMLVQSFVYLFKSSLQAFLYLAAANAIAFLLFFI
jgi:hypothetical protein